MDHTMDFKSMFDFGTMKISENLNEGFQGARNTILPENMLRKILNISTYTCILRWCLPLPFAKSFEC